jgi:HK97 family phage prohead protease
VQLREVRSDSREADFIFSTSGVKRDGIELEQDWRLDDYLRNPVVLFAHNRESFPIGRAKNVGVVDGELRGTVVFGSERTGPDAEYAWNSVREGLLRAISIGWISHSKRWEKRDDLDVLVLSDNELLEASLVPVPADPDALARMRQRAMQINPPPPERGGEPHNTKEESKEMDESQKVRAALDAKTAEVEQLCRDIESERAKVAELQKRCKTLEDERNERQATINELTIQSVKRDLDELVGKKIAPVEVDGLAKLAALDRELFDSQLEAIKARPDMEIVRDAPVVTPDPAPPQTDGASGSGESDNLFAKAERLAAQEA